MKSQKNNIVPVLLGGDLNAYSVAAAFYLYGEMKSEVFARDKLGAVSNSNFINLHIVKELDECERAVPNLLEFSRGYKDSRLILVPCADWYMEMLEYARDVLSGHFYFNIPSFELWRSLSEKWSFYSLLSKFGIKYPSTAVISSRRDIEGAIEKIGCDFVLKPSDSVLYWKNPFPGMKKVYFPTEGRLVRLVAERIFDSGYNGKLLLQKRVFGAGGGSPRASVLTTYSNRCGRVIRAVLGDVLTEERGDTSCGNYSAIITRPLTDFCYRLIAMLDKLSYTGVANFDILEGEAGNFCLELNPRQGRSSDYLRGAGVNLAELLIADLDGRDLPRVFVYPEILWSAIPPSAAIAHAENILLKQRAAEIYRDKGYFSPCRIPEDNRLIRRIYNFIHQMRQVKRLEGKL